MVVATGTQNLTTTTKIYCRSAVPLAARSIFHWGIWHLSVVATRWQWCNREVAYVSFSVAKHWIGGLIIQVNVYEKTSTLQ